MLACWRPVSASASSIRWVKERLAPPEVVEDLPGAKSA
jgi:hypothetical protein